MPDSVLTIAGFDPSSGAGITADLKVFAAHGLYGLACPTAWTVQSTRGVERVEAADPEFVRDTLRCLSNDIAIRGVKIGMLADAAVLQTVIEWLQAFRRHAPCAPVVLDPVIRSSSGRALLAEEAIPLLRNGLLPLVTVITPNLAEASCLAGGPVVTGSRKAIEAAGREILSRLEGRATSVVVTGGHCIDEVTGNPAPDDLLLQPDGAVSWYSGEWIDTSSTHGTGCAFSSALLAMLVKGSSVADAVRAAKRYVEEALRAAYRVGTGRGPMHHLYRVEKTNCD